VPAMGEHQPQLNQDKTMLSS